MSLNSCYSKQTALSVPATVSVFSNSTANPIRHNSDVYSARCCSSTLQLGLEMRLSASGPSRNSKLSQWRSSTYFSIRNRCCRADGRNGFMPRNSSGRFCHFFFAWHTLTSPAPFSRSTLCLYQARFYWAPKYHYHLDTSASHFHVLTAYGELAMKSSGHDNFLCGSLISSLP